MTTAEILQRCRWDQDNYATLEVYADLFGRNVEVRLLPDFDSGRVITEKMAAVLNDFLALTAAELPAVQQYLWADCLDSFENTSYGFEAAPGETGLQANQREFGIHNAEDAYANSNFVRVSIPEEAELRGRYGALDFQPEWAGHGCSIILKDGRLIATYSNDWFFSQYEDAGT